jgi:hypothetical protein
LFMSVRIFSRNTDANSWIIWKVYLLVSFDLPSVDGS